MRENDVESSRLPSVLSIVLFPARGPILTVVTHSYVRFLMLSGVIRSAPLLYTKILEPCRVEILSIFNLR